MRYLLIIAVTLTCLPLSLVAQEDEDDGGFLTRTIEGALSGAGREVNIVGFAGALSSEATFETMTIADAEGIWLTLEEVSLIWSRTALLRGRLKVDSLTASSLKVARLPIAEEQPVEIPPAEAEEFSLQLPELPVSINIDAFEVSEIDLGEPILGVAARLSLKARARLDDDGLFLDLTADRIDEVAGTFALRTNVERDGAEIDLNLTLSEAADGITAQLLNLPDKPSVDLSVAGLGPLDDFTADIALSTAGQPRLAGQVSLRAEESAVVDAGPDRRIRADLGGDITALIAPEYQDFFGPDVGLKLDTLLVADGSVDVQDFSIDAQAVDLAGKVRLNSDMWPSFVDVKGLIAQDDGDVVLPGSDAGVTVSAIGLDISFDETAGDVFTGVFDIDNLQHSAAQVARLELVLDGTLDGSVDSIGRFATDLRLDATGVELSDENTAQALGDAINGFATITYVEDEPIEITDLSLAGPDFGLDGDVVIEGLDGGFPTTLDLAVVTRDLSRFAGLAGRPLSGAADLSVAGRVVPLSSMFDLKIAGSAQDVIVDVPQADALLTGRTELSLGAARDATGTFLRDLSLQNDALDVTADAALRSMGIEVVARVRLSDVALVAPQYQGALSLDADASQSQAGWQIEAALDAPYDARAVVSGLATGPDADLNFDVSIPEIQPLVPDAQGPVSAKGRLWQSTAGYQIDVKADVPFDGRLEVLGLATGPDAKVTFDASLPDMSVLVPDIGGPLALKGDLARAGEGWAVDTLLEGPAGMTATIAGTAAQDASTVDLDIEGAVPLGLAAPFLAPRNLVGQAAFDLALQGAPSLEALSGQITSNGAQFSDPNLRLGLENLDTRVDLRSNTAQLDVGANFVTGGRVEVGGSVNLATLVGDLTIALRDALLLDPNLYAATIGADINVDGPLTGGARIAGQIDLKEVNITVPGTGVTSIGAIPEIRHIGAPQRAAVTQAHAGVLPKEEKQQSTDAPAFPLAIDINAPSKLFVRGRGINAEMGGDLSVRGDTNNIISSGSFDLIRGRLDIIGKRFELDEGSIQFQGSVTPYIRFVTTTQTPEGTASITVDGLADEPDITFSAVPEAPEDEVMSLILFGRYVSELSAFQALQLANGISQLSGRGGVNVLGGLRSGAGLDELDVTTDEDGATSVSAGKYITDTIYTDVTNNSDKGTDISLNIDLTSDLKGKATVAEDGDSSVGFFFERDY